MAAEVTERKPEELTDAQLAPEPDIIVCGEPPPDHSILEFAQFLSLSYPKSRIIYASSNKETYNRALLQKNGLKDAFLIPFEGGEFENCLAGFATEIDFATKANDFRTIRLGDLNSESPLDFDTYLFLPLNKKYVRFTKAGSAIREDQLKKFKEKNFGVVHIRREELQKFYQFSAQQLVALGKSETMSATERQDKMQQAVRGIVSGVFSEAGSKGVGFEDGRELLKDCNEIVKSFIMDKVDDKSALFQKLSEMSRDGENSYGSASNVATFASLFSMGLGIGIPADLALAGMLRDIGLAAMPPEIQMKAECDLSKDEMAEYHKHPEHAIRLLKTKRMAASEKIFDIIMQHHENFDGTGFPNGLVAEEVLPEAQVLALASQFDELLAVKKGQARLSPRQALQKIIDSEAASPVGKRFDRVLLNRIAELLL